MQNRKNTKAKLAKQLGRIAEYFTGQDAIKPLALAGEITKTQYDLWPLESVNMELKYQESPRAIKNLPSKEHQTITFSRATRIAEKLHNLYDDMRVAGPALKQATDIALWMSPPQAIRFNAEAIRLKQTLVDKWLDRYDAEGMRQAMHITRNVIKSSRWHYRENPNAPDVAERLIARTKQYFKPALFYGHQIDDGDKIQYNMEKIVQGVKIFARDEKTMAKAAAKLAHEVIGHNPARFQKAYDMVEEANVISGVSKSDFQKKFEAFTSETNALLDQQGSQKTMTPPQPE